MTFSSDGLKSDYNELLEELKDIISNLKENTIENYKKDEYENILKELFGNFKKPFSYNNSFEIQEMVRIVNYPYHKIPLSTKGSEISNGRYHMAADGPRCLYLASSEEISISETRIKYKDIILNKALKIPKSTFFYNGFLNNVLDIRSQENCLEYGVSYELISEDWQFLNTIYSLKSYTQRLAQKAFDYGYEGILYNSTRNNSGYNIVIFTENLWIDSFISIIGNNYNLQDIEDKNRKIIGYLPNITQ
jgi:RES domain-containing protein